MRNLVLAHSQKFSVASIEYPGLPLVHTLIDPVSDTVFCVFGPSPYIYSIEIQSISVCRLI